MVVSFGKVLVIFLLIKSGLSTPVVEYGKATKYEEYIVEHEISTISARNSALTMDINSIIIPPACQKCNDEEKRYCLGSDLINDHCCCDKRYHEMFPYIPHTCYFGAQLCQTIASDCTEYHRLRTCCCQKYTLEKFNKQFSSTELPQIIRKNNVNNKNPLEDNHNLESEYLSNRENFIKKKKFPLEVLNSAIKTANHLYKEHFLEAENSSKTINLLYKKNISNTVSENENISEEKKIQNSSKIDQNANTLEKQNSSYSINPLKREKSLKIFNSTNMEKKTPLERKTLDTEHSLKSVTVNSLERKTTLKSEQPIKIEKALEKKNIVRSFTSLRSENPLKLEEKNSKKTDKVVNTLEKENPSEIFLAIERTLGNENQLGGSENRFDSESPVKPQEEHFLNTVKVVNTFETTNPLKFFLGTESSLESENKLGRVYSLESESPLKFHEEIFLEPVKIVNIFETENPLQNFFGIKSTLRSENKLEKIYSLGSENPLDSENTLKLEEEYSLKTVKNINILDLENRLGKKSFSETENILDASPSESENPLENESFSVKTAKSEEKRLKLLKLDSILKKISKEVKLTTLFETISSLVTVQPVQRENPNNFHSEKKRKSFLLERFKEIKSGKIFKYKRKSKSNSQATSENAGRVFKLILFILNILYFI